MFRFYSYIISTDIQQAAIHNESVNVCFVLLFYCKSSSMITEYCSNMLSVISERAKTITKCFCLSRVHRHYQIVVTLTLEVVPFLTSFHVRHILMLKLDGATTIPNHTENEMRHTGHASEDLQLHERKSALFCPLWRQCGKTCILGTELSSAHV